MNPLTAETLEFLSELRDNNSSEWFDANRKRYERDLKKPFAALVGEMIGRIRMDDPDVQIQPRDAISRINRDTRFAKDKAPYKTNVYANISPYGLKNKTYPGFYMSFSADQVHIGGGAYMLEPPDLLQVRRSIAQNLDEFVALLKDEAFVRTFGEVQGMRSKTVPPELREAAEKQPLLFGKQFFYMAALEPSVALREDLPELLMEHYFAGKPVSGFLRRALAKP